MGPLKLVRTGLARWQYMPGLATAVVLTTATYLHDTRLLSILAVFAAIFAPFFRWTITYRVRALTLFLVICHLATLLSKIV
jgi:hypothetical protein